MGETCKLGIKVKRVNVQYIILKRIYVSTCNEITITKCDRNMFKIFITPHYPDMICTYLLV